MQPQSLNATSSTEVTGVWWRASRSATIDQIFSFDERSGKRVDQGQYSNIFCIKEDPNKTGNIQSCIILHYRAFRGAQIKGRAISLNTIEM